MAAISAKSKKTLYRLGYIGVLIFVAWGGLMEYLGTYAPIIADPSAGRIYAYNYHGDVVYLNLTEQVLLYALPATAVVVCVVLRIVARYMKKTDERWPPDDNDMYKLT